MKKIQFLVLLLLVTAISFGQTLRPAGNPTVNTTGWYNLGYTRDSAKLFIQRDTFPARYPTVIWHTDGNFYKTLGGPSAFWSLFIPNVPSSGTVTSVGSGYGLSGGPITVSGNLLVDTLSAIVSKNYFSNISVKYWDTTNMLSGYARIGNLPVQLFQRSGINITPVTLGNTLTIPNTVTPADDDILFDNDGTIYSAAIESGHVSSAGSGRWASVFYNQSASGMGVQINAGGPTTQSFVIKDYNQSDTIFTIKGNGFGTSKGPLSYRSNVSSLYNSLSLITKGDVDSTKNVIIDSISESKLKIVPWGDSFTSPNIWQNYLTSWLGYTYYTDGGVAGEDMPAIKARFLAHPELWADPTIIWGGRNGFPDSATVIADITQMVDTLLAHNNTRFFVVSICMPSTAPIGTGDHNLILAINDRLKNLFPNNYIDVNTFLISKYNPSIPQDVTDYANQVIPYSLRREGDNTHLNDTGYLWVARRYNQSISTLLGNPIQYFQNITSGYVQVTSLNRNTLGNGVEIGYDSSARIGYLGVRSNVDGTQRPLIIQNGSADVSILPGGGATLTIGAPTNITGNVVQTGNLTNTGVINTSNLLISAMQVFPAITPSFVMYNAPESGILQRASLSDVEGFLGLSTFLLKSDTAAMLSGYTRLPRFLDTATAIQSRIQTKQPLLTNPVTGTGVSGYLSRWTGATTQDSTAIRSIGGRWILGENATPGSAFDIENAINGLPASSGSAPRGGLRISNSANIALDFFNVSSGMAGVQVSDKGNYATNFPFSINPNGGAILLGTSTNNGVDKLQVNGTINATANTYSSGGYDVLVRNQGTGAFETTTISGISGLTTNFVTKATSSTTVGNSSIFDNGTVVQMGGSFGTAETDGKVQILTTPATASSIALRLSAASATSQILISGVNSSTPATSFLVSANGNVTNTNNSYGAISDIKVKENIKSASPILGKLMSVKVREYNLKSDHKKENHIGVIAQEIEKIFPDMVESIADLDRNGNPTGTFTKSVKYSLFIPRILKALQEQQGQIDSLKKYNKIIKTKY